MKHNKIKKNLAKESAKWHPQGPWRLPSCAYTLEHKLAFLECERSIMGKNTFAGYLHDCDKLFLYLTPWLKEDEVQKIHRKHQPHHAYSPKQNKVKHLIEMYIDWECAAITKPDKPLNAFATLLHFYRDEAIVVKMLPVCMAINPQAVSPMIADLDEARKKKAKEDLLSDLTINRKTYAMVNSLIKQISDEVERLIDNKNWFCIEDILEQPMSVSATAFFVTLRTLEYSRREVVDWYQVTTILDNIKARFANHDCFVADPCAQDKKVDYSSDTRNLYLKKTLSVLLR